MSKKGGKIALALGLITGALTGILFAPQKGKELRSKIMNERKSGGSGAKAVGDDVKQMGADIFDIMKKIAATEEVKGFMGQAKEKALEMANVKKEDLDELVKKAYEKADQMKKLVKDYAECKKSKIKKAVKKSKKSKK
ncbi:MAG: hypothetical protein ACD_51C00109G0004 [uncultured bacterium]|nr:MAG: hypothetical protein ACD_51C00109G0004 [uncultured bacterium]KKT02703.1 MAG: hypothetical protein UV80_C0002G0170 [Candidatus Peregrinibacteria bacterium GW2011_GWF2_43_17]KKT20226.1 MAG: hypothetical protein UW03_C0007G0026 [Candidatus Peregrinibacteria bacterium GW2011_GWA2_43_8]HAU39786.1 hypothetical protein [Candidatus Peregrinibacteria bacterium]